MAHIRIEPLIDHTMSSQFTSCIIGAAMQHMRRNGTNGIRMEQEIGAQMDELHLEYQNKKKKQ